jgi:hypothetical protein
MVSTQGVLLLFRKEHVIRYVYKEQSADAGEIAGGGSTFIADV